MEHDSKKRRTRRELFLEKMDGLVPWEALEALIEPFYPKPGRGRRPYPLRTMLRALAAVVRDPGMEDRGGVAAVPAAVGSADEDDPEVPKRSGRGAVRGATRTLRTPSRGTIVDASIVAAPSSTKNRKGERDPEMHQTKKGNQFFGMKAHIGVDAESGRCTR